MENTFASELRHFAKSVDIVDDEVFDRVRQLVFRYVKNELRAEYFELAREQPIEREFGLQMFWSETDNQHTWRLRGDDGAYSNPVTQALGENQPMWVVATDKSPLTQAETYEDLWSHQTDIPRHQPMANTDVRTLVVVPLRRRRALGVYFFECQGYVGLADVAKSELMCLGEALGIFLELYDAHKSQLKMTGEAIFDLQEVLEASRFPKLTKPRFFMAYSGRSDSEVVTVIREVLDEFRDRLEFTDWDFINDAGNINTQIVREITRSRFGICYLSEPDQRSNGHGHKYVDNPNVVFESGMVHALTSANGSDGVQPTGWIPIRERDSPPAPFDFASERTVNVPRTERGELNESRFRDSLRKRVRWLLDGAE